VSNSACHLPVLTAVDIRNNPKFLASIANGETELWEFPKHPQGIEGTFLRTSQNANTKKQNSISCTTKLAITRVLANNIPTPITISSAVITLITIDPSRALMTRLFCKKSIDGFGFNAFVTPASAKSAAMK
jgi:hypothetical protein